MTAPLLSASPDILQIPADSDSLFSSTGVPFSYLVMLRFLYIVGNLLWFDALATTRKHEFEPPPDKKNGFRF